MKIEIVGTPTPRAEPVHPTILLFANDKWTSWFAKRNQLYSDRQISELEFLMAVAVWQAKPKKGAA